MSEMKSKTVCFTGHRKIPALKFMIIKSKLKKTLKALIDEGYCYFGSGGALGFDTMAAQCVLELRRENPQVKLILVLPCKYQADRWSESDRKVYEDIKSQVDKIVYGQEIWGVIELGYRFPDDTVKPKVAGKIKMTGFTNFCPYTVDLDYFKDARAEFTTSEWIDVLLGAIDYNAAGYKDEDEKLSMLTRLLPFVEKRLNLIELAPKGTGKSYVFGNVSKYGMLTDGGKITRAKMFYDTGRRSPGFICGNDYVAIDEVKLVTFNDVNEMRSIMQGYMEKGTFNIGGYEGKSDAGVIFLGNIAQENMDEYVSMFSELPSLFQESALVDRIHGFIKGWDIPRMNDDLKISGWALNSEYFCSILHMLRDDASYRAIVDKLVEVPEKADFRKVTAIKCK